MKEPPEGVMDITATGRHGHDGFLRANGYRYSTDRHPVSDTPKYVSNV